RQLPDHPVVRVGILLGLHAGLPWVRIECAARGIFAHGLVVLERAIRPRARADPARHLPRELPVPSSELPARLVPAPVLEPRPGFYGEVGHPAPLAEQPLPAPRDERGNEKRPAGRAHGGVQMGRSLREPVARLGPLSFSRSGGEEGEPDQEPEASSDPPNDHDQNRMPKVISNSSRSGSPDITANGFATDTWTRSSLNTSPIAVPPSRHRPWHNLDNPTGLPTS